MHKPYKNHNSTIPDSVTSIYDNAFEDCISLTEIIIGIGVTHIGNNSFDDTPWLNNQSNGLIYVGKVAYRWKGHMPDNTSVTLIDGTKSIGDSLFRGFTGLTSITIPDSVTNIGEYAFSNCTGLTEVTIPNGVTNISYGVFAGCAKLTSITIPDSVTYIGGMAFTDCKSLNSITIPDRVTSIGWFAFADCASLETVTFKSTAPPEFGIGVFGEYPALATIYVPKGAKVAYEEVEQLSGYNIVEIDIECSICGVLNCGITHIYCNICAKYDCGIDHNITLPTDPCEDCDLCTAISSGETNIKGRILGTEEPSIFDALEVLKALVGMDGAISKCGNSLNAALITEGSQEGGSPTIFDALEILKKLVGMANGIDHLHFRDKNI